MRLLTRRRPHSREFEMTPMIDVVLQLIIFFMVTSQVSRLVRSDVDLPPEPGVQEAVRQEGLLVVDVSAAGAILAESRVITRDRFLAMVRAEIERAGGDPAAVRLLVRADRHASLHTINQIARDLAELGVQGWRVGTAMPAATPPGEDG